MIYIEFVIFLLFYVLCPVSTSMILLLFLRKEETKMDFEQNDFNKLIGERLRILRLFSNRTQESMAELLDCSYRHYRRIEKGQSQLCLERLNLLNQYNFDIYYLLWGRTKIDVAIQKALEVMPASMYNELLHSIDELILLSDNTHSNRNSSLYQKMGKNICTEIDFLCDYAHSHWNDITLREVEPINLFTGVLESCAIKNGPNGRVRSKYS